MKDAFFLIIGLAIVFGSIYLFLNQPVNREVTIKTALIKGNLIEVEVADSMVEQARGLSGRTSLSDGQGMLFVYENPGDYGFWMKDMNFSIDIIWIDEDEKIISIERSVSSDSYPKVFHPISPVKFVLEVPAGYSNAKGIDIGDSVYFR
jgi:uncharacterized membrane protein (UPF0127 family)